MRTKYEIVVKPDVQDLEQEVQQRLNDGWTLIGGPFISPGKNVCQAMIRPRSAKEVAMASGAVTKNSDGSLEFGVPSDGTA